VQERGTQVPRFGRVVAHYFGFFFRNDLEGETLFDAGFFFAGLDFDGIGFVPFFKGTVFLFGSAFPDVFFEDFFAVLDAGFADFADFADFDDGSGFADFFEPLEAELTGVGTLAAFFGTGFGSGLDTDIVGFFTGIACLGGSGLGTLTVALTDTGEGVTSSFGADGGDKTGEAQLRLTDSGSIALNCDSNSGESGTS